MTLATALALTALAGLIAASPGLSRSSALSTTTAMHALDSSLARNFGIHHVHASCHRKSRSKFACSWRGRRPDGSFRGNAIVTRAGHGTHVTLSRVRRA